MLVEALMGDDEEKLIFQVLVDSFKAELNKMLYSSPHVLNLSSSMSSKQILANIKKKHLFSVLFQSTCNSQLSQLSQEINSELVEEFNADFSHSISNATILLSKLCAQVIDSSHRCISYLQQLRQVRESKELKQKHDEQEEQEEESVLTHSVSSSASPHSCMSSDNGKSSYSFLTKRRKSNGNGDENGNGYKLRLSQASGNQIQSATRCSVYIKYENQEKEPDELDEQEDEEEDEDEIETERRTTVATTREYGNLEDGRTEIETDSALYACLLCSKKFKTKQQHEMHQYAHLTDYKRFKCDTCGKRFKHKQQLQYHSYVHQDQKPFKCEICSKSFTQKMLLNYHMFKHTGERPYKCVFCGKGFIQKQQLQFHLNTHKVNKPFRCNICKRDFVYKNSLNKHMQLKHPTCFASHSNSPLAPAFDSSLPSLLQPALSGNFCQQISIPNSGSSNSSSFVCIDLTRNMTS